MKETLPELGFTYFTSPEYQLNSHLREWLPVLGDFGATKIIFNSDFDRAIPEDVFLLTQELDIKTVVHFTSELPKARELNKASILFDIYKRRGVKEIILGGRPNVRSAWPSAHWHQENLIENFLDRFIPLANYAIQKNMTPIFPPLQPGGDFWDTSFLELAISGLKNRKLDSLLRNLTLSSFGYTFGKSLTWGEGGPERWPGSKPYQMVDDQENQLGFHNFEWAQKIAERNLGYVVPVIVLDAGLNGKTKYNQNKDETIKAIEDILKSFDRGKTVKNSDEEVIKWPASVSGCYFSLEKIKMMMDNQFFLTDFFEMFGTPKKEKVVLPENKQKIFSHYLLLPLHAETISDVVLNKVKPIIKKLKPTVGFSVDEACFAEKVSVFPDPTLFTEDKINHLRSAGCNVEILPESGIEIATRLQGS